MRGEWIEIVSSDWYGELYESLPVRGEWIEITKIIYRNRR